MDFKDFTASANDNDRRLDKIIRIFVPSLSLPEIYKGIRKGLIKVNKKKSKPESHVFAGDVISIASFLLGSKSDNDKIPGGENSSENSLRNPFENSSPATCDFSCGISPLPPIIFENQHILVLDKPYNLTVHGDEKSLDKIVNKYYQEKNQTTSLSFKPGPLHRIDKKTTGLIVFSMSLEGARWFSENIKNHTISKSYYAILQGYVKDETWQDFITNHHKAENGFYKVEADFLEDDDSKKDDNSKKALTHVKVLGRGRYKKQTVSLVKINIETGRKHQIRAQAALHKHPLLGDVSYGGGEIRFGKQDFYLQSCQLLIPENPLALPPEIKIDFSKDFLAMINYCEIKKSDV